MKLQLEPAAAFLDHFGSILTVSRHSVKEGSHHRNFAFGTAYKKNIGIFFRTGSCKRLRSIVKFLIKLRFTICDPRNFRFCYIGIRKLIGSQCGSRCRRYRWGVIFSGTPVRSLSVCNIIGSRILISRIHDQILIGCSCIFFHIRCVISGHLLYFTVRRFSGRNFFGNFLCGIFNISFCICKGTEK